MSDAAGKRERVLSDNTRRAYESDWRAFLAWCEAGGVAPLPAAPDTVARHLAGQAGRLGRSGLRRRLAAIAYHQRRAGHACETRHPAIAATLRGLLATHGTTTRPAAVLTLAELQRLLAGCRTDTAGLRDRALLLLGFAGALRRSELVAIDREDLRFTETGMTVGVGRRRRETDGEGTSISIPRGETPLLCPVRAMEDWLRRTRIEWGPVFRRLSKGGALEDRLSPQGVWKILRRRAELARLTVAATERLSPHGLRAGGLAQASRKGPSEQGVTLR